jgi:hypothetical protein
MALWPRVVPPPVRIAGNEGTLLCRTERSSIRVVTGGSPLQETLKFELRLGAFGNLSAVHLLGHVKITCVRGACSTNKPFPVRRQMPTVLGHGRGHPGLGRGRGADVEGPAVHPN